MNGPNINGTDFNVALVVAVADVAAGVVVQWDDIAAAVDSVATPVVGVALADAAVHPLLGGIVAVVVAVVADAVVVAVATAVVVAVTVRSSTGGTSEEPARPPFVLPSRCGVVGLGCYVECEFVRTECHVLSPCLAVGIDPDDVDATLLERCGDVHGLETILER